MFVCVCFILLLSPEYPEETFPLDECRGPPEEGVSVDQEHGKQHQFEHAINPLHEPSMPFQLRSMSSRESNDLFTELFACFHPFLLVDF